VNAYENVFSIVIKSICIIFGIVLRYKKITSWAWVNIVTIQASYLDASFTLVYVESTDIVNAQKLYDDSSQVTNDAVGSLETVDWLIEKTSINLNMNVAMLIFVSGFPWSGDIVVRETLGALACFFKLFD